MYVYILAILPCYLLHVYAQHDQPIAETDLGKYNGHYMKTISDRQISAFNGIRYANIPKRFQEAEIVDKHEDMYDATRDGEDCVQISHNFNKYPFQETMNKKMVGSEDCLFLNIYTPNVKPSKTYPVMAWIHGGGYAIGSGASILHGPELLLDKDIVLVTINYRLGPFGFLAYDDEYIPGNIGLKDQSLALHWIKENIHGFGGDPQSITIFGESAGGASVHFQMHSPLNKGIFKRAISQSGSIDCPWALTTKENMKKINMKFIEYLKCPTEPKSLLTCIQEKTVEEIMDAADSLKRMKVKLEMIFKPVFEVNDKGFIHEKDVITRSEIPWLAGVNSGEGLIIYSELIHAGDRNLSDFNANYKQILPGLLYYENHPQAEKITKRIKEYYMADKEFNVNNIKLFTNMFSDGMFIHSQLKSVKKQEGETYLYLFTHQGERSFSTFTQIQHLGAGVQHADDLLYLFSFKKFFPTLQFNEEDLKVSKLFVELWTNFATHGNPTPIRSNAEWYESENGKLYVTLSSDGLQLSKHLYSTRMNFWDDLYTNLHQHNHLKDEL